MFHEGAALDVLPRLDGPFDFVFIDCVKTRVRASISTQLLPKLERGRGDRLRQPAVGGRSRQGVHDASTDALRAFNKRITTDPRLTTIILPLGDGIGISIVELKRAARSGGPFD